MHGLRNERDIAAEQHHELYSKVCCMLFVLCLLVTFMFQSRFHSSFVSSFADRSDISCHDGNYEA